ncbi:hypothetical protein VTK26DRAFT_9135 [Humicola hyalothermophila]
MSDASSTDAAATPNIRTTTDAYSSDTTTRAPSPVEGVNEKKDTAGEGTSSSDEGEPLDTEQGTAEYPTGFKLGAIIIALILGIFILALDMTIVATAIPKITEQFETLADVGWYGSAFFMTLGGFQSTWGKVFKYFDLKFGFLAAFFIFEVGSLICAVAPTSTALIIGRAIAGVGAAGIGSGAFTIVAFSADPKTRPVLTGIVGTSYGVAAAVGPLIGGALTDNVTWRWCFYINLPIGGFSAAVILLTFRSPKAAKPVDAPWREKFLQMDVVGTVLVMGGLIACILAFQYGGQSHAWSDSVVVGLLVGFVVIFIAFGLWEYFNGERSMIVPRLFRRREVWTGSLYMFCFAGSYYVAIYYLPIYFQAISGVSPTGSGVRNLPLILTVTVALIASGATVSATGIAAPIMVFGAAVAAIASGLLYTLDIGTSAGKWIGYQILGGFAWGSTFQVPLIIVQSTSAPEDISSVTAIILFFQTASGAFWISAAQSAFVNQMLVRLASVAPDIDPHLLIDTGVTQLREVFTPEQLPGILEAYMHGIRTAFAIVIGILGGAFLVSPFSRFKRLNSDAVKAAGGAA